MNAPRTLLKLAGTEYDCIISRAASTNRLDRDSHFADLDGPAASQSLTNHPLPAVSASRIDEGRSIGCERGFNNRSLQECEFVRMRRVIASNRPKYSDGDVVLPPTGWRAHASGSLSEERGRDCDRPA